MNPRVKEIVNDSELVKEILRTLERRGFTTFPIEQLREDFPTIDFALGGREDTSFLFMKMSNLIEELIKDEEIKEAWYNDAPEGEDQYRFGREIATPELLEVYFSDKEISVEIIYVEINCYLFNLIRFGFEVLQLDEEEYYFRISEFFDIEKLNSYLKFGQ